MSLLPEVSDELRRELEKHVRTQSFPPPWMYPSRLDDPDQPAVMAGVVAVHMIAPTSTSELEPWLIRCVLRAPNGGPLQIERLAVEHFTDPSVEVTGVVLHRIPAARLRDYANSYLAFAPTVLAQKWWPVHEDWKPSPAQKKQQAERERWAKRVSDAAAKKPLRRGRKGYPVEHYRRIALSALEIHAESRRDVLKELAAREGKPRETVRDWVRRARTLGFLGPTQRGRSQWTAGPNLYPQEGKED